mgnify:CR=1 FL=1
MGLGKTYSTKYLLDSNNSSGVAGQVLSTTSTGIDWADANTLPGSGLWLENGNDIYNSNSGNVGIGTTSPAKQLQLRGSAPFIRLEEDSASNKRLDLWVDPTSAVAYIGANQSAQQLSFQTGNSDRIRILNNGNVGIGTTSPNEKLEVSGKVYIESQGVDWNETTPGLVRGALHFDPVGSGADDTGNAITFGASDRLNGVNAQAGIYTRSDGTYGTKMYFATTDSYSSGSKTAMMIDYTGNVGIGTTSPDKLLDVSSDSTPTIRITNTLQSSSNYTIGAFEFYSEDASNPGGARVLSSILCVNNAGSAVPNGELAFYTALGGGSGAAATEKMRITNAGGISFGSTGTAYGTSGQVLTSAGNTSPTWVTPTTGTVTGSGVTGILPYWTNGPGGVLGDSIVAQGSQRIQISSGGGSLLMGQWDGSNNRIESASRPLFITSYTSPIKLGISGSTTMTIESSNVGIGTTSPAYKLDVSGGDARIANGSTATLYMNNSNNYLYGDANGVGIVGAGNNFRVKTNNSERLRIIQNGNVGIGTTTPNTALQINQSTTVPLLVHRPSNTSFDPHGIGFSTRNDAVDGGLGDVRSGIFSDYNGDLFLAAAQSSITTSPLASSRLFIEGSNGNVGIGTTSPGVKLDVSDVIRGRNSIRVDAASTGSPYLGLYQNGGEKAYLQYQDSGDKLVLQSDGYFALKTGGESDRITVLGNGNVGIGVTGPLSKLHVNGGNISIQNVDSSSPYTASGKLRFLGRYDRYLGGINTVNTGSYPEYDNGLDFYVQRDTFDAAGHFAMRINHLGNVGIGTTSPDTSLTIKTGSSAGLAKISSDGNGAAYSANGDVQFYTNNSAYAINFFSANKGSNLMRITDGGNVGIGTTSPSAKLDVAGTGNFTGLVSGITPVAAANFVTKAYVDGSGGGTGPFLPLAGGTISGTPGTLLISGLSNYTGLTVKGAGASRPAITWSNVSQGDLGIIYGTENSALVIATGASGLAALTLDSSQNATFAGDVSLGDAKFIKWGNGNQQILGNNTSGLSLYSNGERMRILTNGNVGIGTTSPTNLLSLRKDVAGGDVAIYLQNYNSVVGSTDETVSIKFAHGNDGGSGYVGAKIVGGKEGDFESSPANVKGFMSFYTNEGSLTSQVEQMRINGDGNVGIGTTSPLGKLMVRDDIAGAPTRLIVSNNGTAQSGTSARLSFYEGTSEKGYIERRRDGSGKIAFVTPADDNPFVWENPTGEIMRINNSKVGIGTTAPTRTLDVRTDSGVLIKGATGTANAKISFLPASGGRQYDLGNVGADFRIFDASAGVTRMYFDNDGNTGIGTTTPGYKLDVVSAGDGLLSLTGATKPAMIFKVGTAVVGGIQAQANTSLNVSAYGTSSLNLQTAGTAPRLTILTGGNVGINQTAPAGILHVQDAVTGDTSQFLITNGTGATLRMGITGSGTNENAHILTNSGEDLEFQIGKAADATTPSVIFKSGGNVGIGTNSPNTQLEILNNNDQPATLRLSSSVSDGDAVAAIISFQNEAGGGGVQGRIENIATEDDTTVFKFYNDNSSSPSMTLNDSGNMTIAGTLTQNSDVRLKENIKPIESALDKVKQMQGVEFNKINSSTKEIGVVAQEIEKIIPELVLEDKEGIKSVAYGNITAVLIEAIKEQQKQIEELKQQLNK